MDDIEVPQYFICPISLQIMRDPVTAITGITYDRESIERWLMTSRNTTCPVTNQPLPRDLDLTPNHTLRRLIQSWCTDNASRGVDRIPTPRPPLDKFRVLEMMRDFGQPLSQIKVLRKLELLMTENERNRKYMVEAGVPKAMLLFIETCFKKGQPDLGLQEALNILSLIQIPSAEARLLLTENHQIIESLTWILGFRKENHHNTVRSDAVIVLKRFIETAGSKLLERLNPPFFQSLLIVLGEGITQQGKDAALSVLLEACPWGRNRRMMIESCAVLKLIDLELGAQGKKTTELILGILFHLCSCAEGRAQFLSHRGGLAVLSNRILRVSEAVDERVVSILSLITKFSGTNMVLQEMLEVGAVSKLRMLLHADCAPRSLKEKAREILRSNSVEWKK